MGYVYGPVMAAAIDLESYVGYLNGEDRKQQLEAQGRFNKARNLFVFEALNGENDPALVKAAIIRDMDEMAAAEPSGAATYAYVRDELVARIEKESSKSPLHRKIVRWTPTAIVVALVITYFLVRLMSGVTIDQPIETRKGIEQRAAAVAKVVRYEDWMSSNVRRGGFLKGFILWPIEPTDKEIAAADEFAGMAFDGLAYLSTEKQICGGPTPGTSDSVSRDEVKFVMSVAEHVRDKQTKWLEPPAMTMLEPIKEAYPCGSAGTEQ